MQTCTNTKCTCQVIRTFLRTCVGHSMTIVILIETCIKDGATCTQVIARQLKIANPTTAPLCVPRTVTLNVVEVFPAGLVAVALYCPWSISDATISRVSVEEAGSTRRSEVTRVTSGVVLFSVTPPTTSHVTSVRGRLKSVMFTVSSNVSPTVTSTDLPPFVTGTSEEIRRRNCYATVYIAPLSVTGIHS